MSTHQTLEPIALSDHTFCDEEPRLCTCVVPLKYPPARSFIPHVPRMPVPLSNPVPSKGRIRLQQREALANLSTHLTLRTNALSSPVRTA